MSAIGIVNLGVSQDYIKKLETNIFNSIDINGWIWGSYEWDHKKLDIDQIIESCSALVLSPGNAKIGLLTEKRAKDNPEIKELYELIEKAVEEGIPLLGINAGHEAINCAYGWAIDPVNDKENYQKQTTIQITDPDVDPILKKLDSIDISLTNGYAVLPREKNAKRPNQDKVTQLVDHLGYPLISRVESDAPVYGVQFNPGKGTEIIFRNFFDLALKYITEKK